MKQANLDSIQRLLLLVGCSMLALPIGFPSRVVASEQALKLTDDERYFRPPMDPQAVEWINKLSAATPEEKILLRPKFRQFMANQSKNYSENISRDTLVTPQGKPDFKQFWTDWYHASAVQRAALLIKFRDVLKARKQEGKIFSVIDDGCGTAIKLAPTGCGTYTNGLQDLNIGTAESLTKQQEFTLAAEIYRVTR